MHGGEGRFHLEIGTVQQYACCTVQGIFAARVLFFLCCLATVALRLAHYNYMASATIYGDGAPMKRGVVPSGVHGVFGIIIIIITTKKNNNNNDSYRRYYY